MVAMLAVKDHEANRRIYSADGIGPTIRTPGGGGIYPRYWSRGDRVSEKRIIHAGIVPNYRPSGSHGVNIIIGGGGAVPYADHTAGPFVRPIGGREEARP